MEPWHEKFTRMQRARGWSNRDAAVAFIAASPHHADRQLESVEALLKRYRRGDVATPEPETRRAIAAMFDLPVGDFWPDRPLANENVPDRLSPDAFTDLVGALRLPKVGNAHLEQAEAEVERLCTAYASQDAPTLTVEVDQWMGTLSGLVRDGRVSLSGHQQVYRLSGWLSLLRSCLMWDQGDESAMNAARVAAEGLAGDLNDPVMAAWTHEIRAWVALTQGDMPQVVAAADAGLRCAPTASVSAQLWAQKAKAYSRMADAHKTEVALEHVRQILDACEMPANVRNHFSVDPTKASFYAMDAYRTLGPATGDLADGMAETVIRTSTRPDGTVISPMRLAEAQLTKALIAARDGSTEAAVDLTHAALGHERRSGPSLLFVAGDVARQIEHYNPSTGRDLRDHLRIVSSSVA